MRRVQQLAKEHILTKCNKDEFRCVNEVQAYMKYSGCSTSINPKKVDYNAEKALLTKAQREKAELTLGILKGRIYEAEFITPLIFELLLGVRNRLLAVPQRIAHLVLSCKEMIEIEEIIKKEIYDALTELADFTPESLIQGKDNGINRTG